MQLRSSPSVPSTIPEDSSSGARGSPSTTAPMQPLSPLSNAVSALDRGSRVGALITPTKNQGPPRGPPSASGSSGGGSTRSDSFNPVEEPSWLQPDVSPLGPLDGGLDRGVDRTIGAAYQEQGGRARGSSPTREEREILQFVQTKVCMCTRVLHHNTCVGKPRPAPSVGSVSGEPTGAFWQQHGGGGGRLPAG